MIQEAEEFTPKIMAYPDTQEWLALRKYDPDRDDPVIFGASEAAAVCGQDPYRQPLEVYLEKRGEAPEVKDEKREKNFRKGRVFEGAILTMYEIEQDCYVHKHLPMFRHPELSYMAATPDGVVTGKDRLFPLGPPDRLIEAKSTNWRRFDRTGEDAHKFGAEEDEVPVTYLLQGQQQLAVTGCDVVEFPVWSDELTIYRVRRNEDIIAAIADAERELAERIINADPPEPQWEHSTTVDLINSINPIGDGVVELGPDADTYFREYLRAGEDEKNAKARKDQAKARLLYLMGEAKQATVDGHILTRSEVAASYVTADDVKDLAKRVGTVKRKGHIKLTKRKAKK